MKRIMIRVAYDGTDFHGWQYQPETRTVEGELNRAIKELTGEEIQIIGASRTDAGVHALGFDDSAGTILDCIKYQTSGGCKSRFIPGGIRRVPSEKDGSS